MEPVRAAWIAGIAASLLAAVPGLAQAQASRAELEQRVAQLERLADNQGLIELARQLKDAINLPVRIAVGVGRRPNAVGAILESCLRAAAAGVALDVGTLAKSAHAPALEPVGRGARLDTHGQPVTHQNGARL